MREDVHAPLLEPGSVPLGAELYGLHESTIAPDGAPFLRHKPCGLLQLSQAPAPALQLSQAPAPALWGPRMQVTDFTGLSTRPIRVLLAVTRFMGRSPLPSFLGLGMVGLSVLLPPKKKKKNSLTNVSFSSILLTIIFHASDSSVLGFFDLFRMMGLVGSWNVVSLIFVPLEEPHFNNIGCYRHA